MMFSSVFENAEIIMLFGNLQEQGWKLISLVQVVANVRIKTKVVDDIQQ